LLNKKKKIVKVAFQKNIKIMSSSSDDSSDDGPPPTVILDPGSKLIKLGTDNRNTVSDLIDNTTPSGDLKNSCQLIIDGKFNFENFPKLKNGSEKFDHELTEILNNTRKQYYQYEKHKIIITFPCNWTDLDKNLVAKYFLKIENFKNVCLVPQSLAALVSTGCDLKDREKILIIDVGFRLVQMTIFENFEILASCFHLLDRDSRETKILEKIDCFQTHKDISKIYLIGGGINHLEDYQALKTRLTKTISIFDLILYHF